MKDSCIIAPIHPPYFSTYGKNFVSSYNEYFNDDHLFLVFSNSSERDHFSDLNPNLRYRSIVCDQPIGKSPITQKKLFGLNYVFSETDFSYAGVFDVDTLFTSHKEYDTIFKTYQDRKKIFANKLKNPVHVQSWNSYTTTPFVDSTGSVDLMKTINFTPFKFFNSVDQQKLRDKMQNCSLYFWFNDIPVYDKNSFFRFIEYVKPDHTKLEYWDFDYIMYGYYLLLNENFEIETIMYDGSVAESASGFIEQQHKYDETDFKKSIMQYDPMWLKIEYDDESMKNVFVRLHVHSTYR